MIVDVTNQDNPRLLLFSNHHVSPCSYFDMSTSGVNLTRRRGFHSCKGRRAKPLSRAVVIYGEEGVRVASENGEACGRARALQSCKVTARGLYAYVRDALFYSFFFLAWVPSKVYGGNRASESRSSFAGH